MGFDANLEVVLYYEGGRPFFYSQEMRPKWSDTGLSIEQHLVSKKEFDLSKLPTLPAEFQSFEKLRGWSFGAVFLNVKEDDSVDTLYLDTLELSYENVKKHPEFDDDISPELFEKFKNFCTWAKQTGIWFYYRVSY